MKNEAFAPTPELLAKMDAWWRAANYLSACQLYLLDDPLLRRRLTERDIKKKIVGHWGTVPGQNFIYTHLNRVINEYDLDMIYLSGPGHGGNAMVAQDYLDGSYTDVYPNITRDAAGMQRLFKQFSFPGGIPSHVAPETPGSIHEGGELGYSLAHAFGAVMDNPDLLAASVVGVGPRATGPRAPAGPGPRPPPSRHPTASLPQPLHRSSAASFGRGRANRDSSSASVPKPAPGAVKTRVP